MSISPIGLVGNFEIPSAQGPAVQRRRVIQAANTLNQSGALGKNELVFSVDSQTHRPIIRVEDRDTHEVVLQLPPEYVIQLAENLGTGAAIKMPHLSDT